MALKASSERALVIVESPAKAKTIQKFLGRGYIIKASMGHVRDLASGKGKGQIRFGIDFANRYQPVYVPIKGREKTLEQLAKAAEECDIIYLAPDPDREGEAIAWHIAEALHLSSAKTRRVTFNAITKSAVTEAMAHARDIDLDRVNAQQARRVLDRIVGFSLSPLLWKKVAKGLSAGRVQSVAVRMVVEREKEIQAFITEEFWRLTASLNTKENQSPETFFAQLVSWKGNKLWQGQKEWKGEKNGLRTLEQANEIQSTLKNSPYLVSDLIERKSSSKPNPAYITSTLQQAASTFLGSGPRKTMRIAQQLYEGVEIDGNPTGLITYMRTDSVRIAPEAIQEAREYIAANFPPEYLPEQPNVYSSKKDAQDAHEAIRPAIPSLAPEAIRNYLTEEQYRLYTLIWRRFMASQMTGASYLSTTAVISAGEASFEAKGKQVLFDGHTVLAAGNRQKAVNPEEGDSEGKEENQLLPLLKVGALLSCEDLVSSQHFTPPPPRYSEASLVRALEKEGIGRPSTYAPIVQTIQERGYVRLESRRFFASELGSGVTELLQQGFPEIMDYSFTAEMEAKLDHIEEGKMDWVKVIDEFYLPFAVELGRADLTIDALKGKPAPAGEICPQCETEMTIRYSKNGAFLSCTKYPECKGTRPLDEPGVDDDVPVVECPECSAIMQKKRGRFGQFMACPKYPDCKGTLPLDREGQLEVMPIVEPRDCEKCGRPMGIKRGRKGFFLSCSGYPECKNAKPITKEGQIIDLPDVSGTCEKCQSSMVVRNSRRGPFLGCTGYPKCRNAKPIPEGTPEGTHIDFSLLSSEELGLVAPEKKTVKKKAAPKKKAKKKITAKKTTTKQKSPLEEEE